MLTLYAFQKIITYYLSIYSIFECITKKKPKKKNLLICINIFLLLAFFQTFNSVRTLYIISFILLLLNCEVIYIVIRSNRDKANSLFIVYYLLCIHYVCTFTDRLFSFILRNRELQKYNVSVSAVNICSLLTGGTYVLKQFYGNSPKVTNSFNKNE